MFLGRAIARFAHFFRKSPTFSRLSGRTSPTLSIKKAPTTVLNSKIFLGENPRTPLFVPFYLVKQQIPSFQYIFTLIIAHIVGGIAHFFYGVVGACAHKNLDPESSLYDSRHDRE